MEQRESWLAPLERVVRPSLVDGVLWTATHLDDLLWTALRLPSAYLLRPDREVYTVIAKLVRDDPATWPATARALEREGRYVVVSDHHLLYSGSPHDWFGGIADGARFRNAAIYRRMMAHYGSQGWTLVENGDVEDLIVPAPAYDRIDCLKEGALGTVLFGLRPRLRDWSRKRQLLRIAKTYAEYYEHLLTCFGPKRIVKLVGNHDAELLRPEFQNLSPLAQNDVEIHEFAVVPGAEGEPAVVICHGHQMDPWTCRATANQIGESITESVAWMGQGADRTWETRHWGPPLAADNRLARLGFGRANGLVPKVRHMSETDLDRSMRATFADPERPWLVLGHTHEPRFRLGERYVNTAASGRYQDLVWAAEIVGGVPKLVAWWAEVVGAEEHLFRAELQAAGDWLHAAARVDLGPLDALGPRPSLAEIDAEIAAEGLLEPRPRTAGWLVLRVGVHLLFLGGVVAGVALVCAGLR